MVSVTNLWRHPIKGIGREQLNSVALKVGKTMPWDRHWAIAHENAEIDFDAQEWAQCKNFLRAANAHQFMAVSSKYDEKTGLITLQHAELPNLTVNPDHESTALIEWAKKISDPKKPMPARVFKALDRGLTDSGTASLSILSTASLDALSKATGAPLDQRRFRGNIWLDGMPAWKEFDWIGKKIRIGQVEFEVTKPVERCIATTVNPDTGVSDVETLKALRTNWGHIDFGVFGIVTKAGEITLNDTVEVL